MSKHRSTNRAKAKKAHVGNGRHRALQHRPEISTWLGAGAVTLGVGAALAALLMPKPLVEASLQRHMPSGVSSREELISVLAREFDVSSDAMGWRLTNLGILST
jgi:hypothetical protein